MNDNLFRPLVFALIVTVAYGLALYVLKNFEALSFIYHIGLLAIAIYYARGLGGLGLRIGNFRYGVVLCVGFFGYWMVRLLIWGMPKFAFALDLAALSTVFFAPVTEELFWRGLILQRTLKYAQIDPIVAVVGNAGLFTLTHIPRILSFSEGAITLLAVLMLGIIFATIYYLSKSSCYSTVAHVIHNIFAL